jgi:antitoxin component of MazEF toxin-antitoxin module
LLKACGLGEDVNLAVRDKTLVITPARKAARTSWAEAIQKIPQEALDRDYAELQAFRETPEEWDAHGWQWPEGSNREEV